MGTCDLKWIWNLGMMSYSIEWFLKVNMTKRRWWFLIKLILVWMRYLSNIEYPHNTWLWVGLNWKFMHLSMGSLWTHIIGVMLEAASAVEKWCELRWIVRPSPVQFPGWQLVFTGRPSSWGEVLILGFVSERLWLMIRVLCYDDSG